MKGRYYLLIIVILSISFGSCKNTVRDFKYMMHLQKILSAKYTADRIDVNITNGKLLKIDLVNMETNEQNPDEKQKIALEIGSLVAKDTINKPALESGIVQFVEEHGFLFIHVSTSESFDMHLQNPGDKGSL